jgi:hypothetical protein
MKLASVIAAVTFAGALGSAQGAELCQKFGPQTPRDITSKEGANLRAFPLAPAATTMNLCNIHFHVNAEHKGPGFSVSAGTGEHGGYRCNETSKLTQAELTAREGGCKGLEPGDTIEVHWVYSSCDIAPGKGLGACLSDQCANPTLRVEAQVFLVVNSKSALNFADLEYAGAPAAGGLHQAKSLPTKTGTPVVFRGSTTGPTYTEEKCSPLQVTWSVRPRCAKIDINSLHKWCEKNVFKEDHGHGVRQLVRAPSLLDKIK